MPLGNRFLQGPTPMTRMTKAITTYAKVMNGNASDEEDDNLIVIRSNCAQSIANHVEEDIAWGIVNALLYAMC